MTLPTQLVQRESGAGQSSADQSSAGQAGAPMISAASCAATACHGGPRAGVSHAGAQRGSEYTLWLESDPHRRSWETICSPQSQLILKRLNIFQDGVLVDQIGFNNCLACHNTVTSSSEINTTLAGREGIGCSACHGPDTQWRSTHFQADWDRQAALSSGFAPTKELLTRARICASCHVGDRDRDMNHDIIAAGHPALHYDFATFHQRLPKHWREDSSESEAKQWLCGQIASLDAFLTLLEFRANEKLLVGQWPELAAFDCTSCHQNLTLPDVDATAKPREKRSQSALSQWHQFGVRQVLLYRSAHGSTNAADQDLLGSLKSLQELIQSPSASGKRSAHAAQQARLSLDRWLTVEGQAEINSFTATRLAAILSANENEQISQFSWESAAQFYLASVAARDVWRSPSGDVTNIEVLSTARKLRSQLQFRPGTNSPMFRFPGKLPDGNTSRGPQAAASLSLNEHWRALQATVPTSTQP